MEEAGKWEDVTFFWGEVEEYEVACFRGGGEEGWKRLVREVS